MKICPTFRVSLPKPKALGVAVALACSGVAALAGDSSVLITDFSYVSSAGTLTWLGRVEMWRGGRGQGSSVITTSVAPADSPAIAPSPHPAHR